MSRSWQPDTAPQVRATSPVRGVASMAAAESKDASLVSTQTAAINATGLKFGQSVSLSDAHKQRRAIVNKYGGGDAAIDHCTLDGVAQTAQALAAEGKSFAAVIADGTVTRDDVERFVDNDTACAALTGLTLIRSVRSTAAMAALLESMVRDEAAYTAYCKKEEAQRVAREEREQRAREREAAGGGEAEDEEPLEDAEAEDLGPKPPRPTQLKPHALSFVHEAPSFADNATASADLAKLVEQSSELDTLRVVGCGATGAACSQLATAVLSSRTLTALDLSENGFGRDEEPPTEAVAAMLQQSKFLLDVNLADNDLNPAMVKQIAEALATSDTRVPTPEPEPAPEFEPWVDELPEPDEAPAQAVGYPPEEGAADGAAPAEAGEGEAAPAAGAEDADAEAAEKEEGADDEDADDEADEAGDAKKTAAEEDDEIDEEEAERLAEERAEAERAAREEAEAAWREREEQYIWGPQRAHQEHEEHLARRAILQTHIDETAELKKIQHEDRLEARRRQLDRERLDRERRSGWSHLTALSLAGNPFASEGAVALADALRSEIPLPKADADGEPADGDDEAPAADAAADEDAADEPEEAEENEEEAAGDDEGAPADAAANNAEAKRVSPPPEPPKTKKGFATLKKLDVSRASIGSKGMVALAGVIADNAPSLTAVDLTRNKFALKHQMIRDDNAPPRADDAAEDGEEEAPPMKRVPITTWVSPGVEALANLLRTNRTLRTLRIGHNHLYPESAAALFKAIRGNGALLELSLEGNPIGFGNDTATFGLLLDALQTMPQIERLNVANTGCAAAVAAAPADKVACLFRIAHVDLGFNAFGRTPGALRSLAAAAKQCQAHNVKSLTLDGNHFDAAAMPEMPGYLLDVVGTLLRRLEAFSIAGNPKLGTQTCRDLLKLLGTGPALRRVSVRGSRADAADSGARLVEAAGYLAELDLGDIVATEAGAVDVCAAAVKSSTLASLALWSRDTDLGNAVMAHLAQHPPRALTQVDAGCRRPTGREPTDDSDHAFDVEDVESALLANRLRACRRVS